MTVIIPEGTPDPGADAGVAFAAGVATQQAEQAQTDAAKAGAVAEMAAEIAESAAESARLAESEAWATRDELGMLRAEVEALRAERVEPVIDPVLIDELSPEPVAAPAAEPVETEPAPKKGKAKKSGYGSKTWFGR